MKEDIIILETAIKYSKKQFEEIGEYTLLDNNKMQAIENLIKKYKEFESYYQCEVNLLDKYVSKDKIKDKIEELNKNLNTVEHYETIGAIHELEKLLEEE